MDLDRFNVAVHRVQAGQFLREKAASVTGVNAIDAALQARAGQAEDPDLLKIATQLCPEDALGFYMKLGGKLNKKPDWAGNIEEVLAKDEKEFPKRPKGESTNEYIDRTDREWATKKAEPGPPPGVSSKEWDKVLQKGPEKEAAVLGKVRRVTEGFMKDYARHGDKAMQMPRGQKMVELSSKLMRRGGSFAGGEEAYAASRGYQHKDKKLVELGERLFNAEKTAGIGGVALRGLASAMRAGPVAGSAATFGAGGAMLGAAAGAVGNGAVSYGRARKQGQGVLSSLGAGAAGAAKGGLVGGVAGGALGAGTGAIQAARGGPALAAKYNAALGLGKTAGDVVQFTRPLSSKIKDVVQRVLPAANGTVRRVDFTNPEGVRGALSKARDATARAAHNAKAMKNGKPSSLSDTLSYAKGALPFVGAAALAGGVSGHIRGKATSASDRRKEEAKAGPIGRAIIRHPALAGAASAGAGTMLGLHAKTFPGALAGAVAPGLAALGADRVLKHFEDKKKGR